MRTVPPHLAKYIVEQPVDAYTAIDQAVWRFLMRQLRDFLSTHGHPVYLSGLEETGISVESIPSIKEMSEKLENYGWRAIPVSGFIPPAAFMELQALGFLPIASDIRTLEHLEYTPAPDIVHEAAGHAPILIDPEYSNYLRKYAQVAGRAILNFEDLEIYEAIRDLSDIKENRNAKPHEIEMAQNRLDELTERSQHSPPSEAALLARMNWWTAEYGLVGDIKSPLIYGAGLLSSFGESRTALSENVKKIPFSIECIQYSYDITEPQPQLFVTPDFNTLGDVLEDFASTLAYRKGGTESLEKILKSRTVNTVQLNSGIQISGILSRWIPFQEEAAYLQFQGPCQLSFNNQELPNQGRQSHPDGFGTPVGFLKDATRCLSEMSQSELADHGITEGRSAELAFKSGVHVRGKISSLTYEENRLVLISFENCSVTLQNETLFKPEWGTFDMAVGSSVPSVFGGPADREAFGETSDFVAKRVQVPPLSEERSKLNDIYRVIRSIRENRLRNRLDLQDLENVLADLTEFPEDWLARLELLELALTSKTRPSWEPDLRWQLENLADQNPNVAHAIRSGLAIAEIL